MLNSTDGMTQDDKIPDLTGILDKIDFEKKPISHGQLSEVGNFNASKWGSLIFELLAYPDEQQQVLDAFGLSHTQYATLCGNKLFQAVRKDIESSLSALAANGGFQLSARRLAEQSFTVVEDIMRNGEKDKDRLEAARMAVQLANLDPVVQARLKEKESGGNGVQLVFNMAGGMPLPDAFKGKETVVLEAESEVIND